MKLINFNFHKLPKKDTTNVESKHYSDLPPPRTDVDSPPKELTRGLVRRPKGAPNRMYHNPKNKRCEGEKHHQRTYPIRKYAHKHTKDRRWVQCETPKNSTRGMWDQDKTEHIFCCKQISIRKNPRYGEIFLKLPPQRTDARVWEFCSKRRSFGGRSL